MSNRAYSTVDGMIWSILTDNNDWEYTVDVVVDMHFDMIHDSVVVKCVLKDVKTALKCDDYKHTL